MSVFLLIVMLKFLYLLWDQVVVCADIPIGFVYESHRATELLAVQTAVKFANQYVLAESVNRLSLRVRASDSNRPLDSLLHSCDLLQEGIVAQIGPGSSSHVSFIAPYFDRYQIPLLAPVASSATLQAFKYLIRMVPSDQEQASAIGSIIDYFKWKRVILLSSDDDYGVLGTMNVAHVASEHGWEVISIQRFSSRLLNVHEQLKEIKETDVRIIVLYCLDYAASAVLRQAHDRSMTGEGWIWIVTDGVTNSDRFIADRNNFTIDDSYYGLLGTGFLTSDGALYSKFVDHWRSNQRNNVSTNDDLANKTLTANIVKWADAVLLLAYAVQNDTTEWLYETSNNISCALDISHILPSKAGDLPISAIRNISAAGISQSLTFSVRHHYPLNIAYTILNLQETGWKQVGVWDKVIGLQTVPVDHGGPIWLPGKKLTASDFISALNGRHVNVVTVAESPFYMWVNGKVAHNLSDIQPHEMEGYGIDLLVTMSKNLNFTYRLYNSPDGQWGRVDETTREWNGLMRELIARRADMAFATFTITADREKEIDWSVPYLDQGIQFIMLKDEESGDLFEFTKPFSAALWTGVLLTILLVTTAIALFEKISPVGHHGEFIQCSHRLENLKTRRQKLLFRRERREALTYMNLPNSFWFTMTAILRQGYGGYPQAISSRTLISGWFLGITIVLSTYTAQLGAFLISSRLEGSIDSIEDLFKQNKIKYTANGNTSVVSFFCDSNVDMHRKMCTVMEEENLFVKTPDAVEKINAGEPLAYLGDSAVLDGLVEKKPCKMRVVGEIFGKSGFGIGLQKGSPFQETVSMQILQLKEQGFMDQLHYKWYTARSECKTGTDKPKTDIEKNQRHTEQMRGVLYVIFFSMPVSLVVLCIEWLVSSWQLVIHNDVLTTGHHSFTLAHAVQYRCSRIKRDFVLYYVPTQYKEQAGVKAYARQVQPRNGMRDDDSKETSTAFVSLQPTFHHEFAIRL